jgi:hypothetical protein
VEAAWLMVAVFAACLGLPLLLAAVAAGFRCSWGHADIAAALLAAYQRPLVSWAVSSAVKQCTGNAVGLLSRVDATASGLLSTIVQFSFVQAQC